MMLCRVKEKVGKLFDTVAPELYATALNAVIDCNMAHLLEKGVILGFSGGADSVFLLCFLSEYRRREGKDFPIVACHVNHMIRGEEALRDMEFSRDFASALGIEFVSVNCDVPTLAKERGCGLEEAARDARYATFEELNSKSGGSYCIALAHNASDNLETVIFNMMRGAGLNGMCGILPVRGNIVRPLIKISKRDILKALLEADLPYVIDSTNMSVDYTRNYIRHKIVPELSHLNASPEDAVSRLTESLSVDNDYLSSLASSALLALPEPVTASSLAKLDTPILLRVLMLLCKRKTGFTLESKHTKSIIKSLNLDNFSLSIGGGYSYVCQRGICKFLSEEEQTKNNEVYFLSAGENKIDKYSASVMVLSDSEDILSNVYKFSIHAIIPSAIINGDLHLRFRREGDYILLRGHKRKLKKILNDMDIPPFDRERIPLLCDDLGIVWIPGVGIRDYVKTDYVKSPKIKIVINCDKADSNEGFFLPLSHRFNKKD